MPTEPSTFTDLTTSGKASFAGRTPIPVSVFGAPMREETIEQYEALGVHRAVFFMPPAEADVVLPRLQHAAKVAGL